MEGNSFCWLGRELGIRDDWFDKLSLRITEQKKITENGFWAVSN